MPPFTNAQVFPALVIVCVPRPANVNVTPLPNVKDIPVERVHDPYVIGLTLVTRFSVRVNPVQVTSFPMRGISHTYVPAAELASKMMAS